MLVVISYDIECDRVRTRLSKKLKDFGPRVQKSVFEVDITEKEIERLHEVIKKVKLNKNDSIRIYQLCSSCRLKITIRGVGEVTEDREYWIS